MLRLMTLCCLAIGAGVAVAQQPAAEPPAAEDDSLELFNRAADEYRLSLTEDERELRREASPLLRWSNPIRDSNRGVTLLWTDKGRPQAIACLYTYGDDSIDHEFQSLAVESLQAEHAGKIVWGPKPPGIQWRLMPDADKPAATAAARLLQMRSLARRFAAVVYQKQDPHELRLLPRPLYRYPSAGEDSSDGSLFAFVQATDPELLLLLEVQATKTGPAWHYGLARMTDLALDVKLDGRSAWKVDPWDWRKRHPSHMYIKFTQKVRR